MPGVTERPGFATALGRTITVLRTDQGLDRRSLAQRAAISYSYLSAIEAGTRHPSAAVLHRIAGALGMRSHHLQAAAERRFDRLLGAVRPAPGEPPGAAAHRETATAEILGLLASLDDEDVDVVLAVARRLARPG